LTKAGPVSLRYQDIDEPDDDLATSWALGYDDECAGLAQWDLPDGESPADAWLDEQLARPGSPQGPAPEVATPEGLPSDLVKVCDTDGPVLRRPAPRRVVRRRAAAGAPADLPAPMVPGYLRDRRGTWRYASSGRSVPGARDVTLRALHRFPSRRGKVLVPLRLAKTEPELAWCLVFVAGGLTTRVDGTRFETVVEVPAGEWAARADVPVGLYAPELDPTRLLDAAATADLCRVSRATIASYLSRGAMPPPAAYYGGSPVWSRPVIHQWLATRPGQGARPKTPRRR
jgi:predicted DNA-binding transcriptional regulator AlpA